MSTHCARTTVIVRKKAPNPTAVVPVHPGVSQSGPMRGAVTAPQGMGCACGAGCPRCRDTGASAIPPVVHDVLRDAGRPLDADTRNFMERRFGQDFSAVRVHTDTRAANSAKQLSALAYTAGRHVVFGRGQYGPADETGRALLAHELTHVVQQGTHPTSPVSRRALAPVDNALEAEARSVEDTWARREKLPAIHRRADGVIRRKVEMRDVGRGEQSGYARLPELIRRLNAVSGGLTFSMRGHDLVYAVRPGATLNDFDHQMMGFIDQATVIPLRLTNRHGLLGNRTVGFHWQVQADAWASGYVDMDDLLASSDVGMQLALLHFLRERSATHRYAQRIGSASMDTSQPGPAHEFRRAHGQGIQAEVEFLRNYFGDPTVRFVREPHHLPFFRIYRNSRGDIIRARIRIGHGAQFGIDAVSVDVVTRDGRVHTAEQYRRLLAQERGTRQRERDSAAGAAEHREGGHAVPAL